MSKIVFLVALELEPTGRNVGLALTVPLHVGLCFKGDQKEKRHVGIS